MESNEVRNFVTRLPSLPSLVDEPVQLRINPVFNIGSRWESCLILQKAGIPHKIWTDLDVFGAHGLRSFKGVYCEPSVSQRNDIHLLVDNLDEAATALGGAGYSRTNKKGDQQYSMGYCEDNNRKFLRLVKVSAVSTFSLQQSFKTAEDIACVERFALGQKPKNVTSGTGVFLMLAKDWNYSLSTTLDPKYQPIPGLSEYFDSYISLWMDLSFLKPPSTSRLISFFHIADVLDVLLHEAHFVGTEQFEKDIMKEHRQVLFDLMERRYYTTSISHFLLFAAQFRANSMFVRDQIKAGLREPVFPSRLTRKCPRRMHSILLPRGQANEQLYRMQLPRFTWLIDAPLGNGWWLFSFNVVLVLKHKKWHWDSKRFEKRFGRRPMCLPLGENTPIKYWAWEYSQVNVLAGI